ncbi:hypothetical protein KKE06_05620, partial [Candidatus Micrarchaeota archaeon]|nr:hypothetical protein [Candidatus Micrarchaeota archaeon]MBU1930015.1 hypothetical protein [Candidatus Micrarchaeota archaeon]
NASCDTILPSLIDILGANLPQNSESGGNTCTAGKCLENFMGDPVVCSTGGGVPANCNKSC